MISLSGNIPASLLRINSITLPGYCLKLLKSISKENIEENKEEILCTLMALVKWGRGSDILEQITLWLDAAFETQNMNETVSSCYSFSIVIILKYLQFYFPDNSDSSKEKS